MNLFSYFLPTRVFFGSGSLQSLPELIKTHFFDKKRIFLATGRSFLKKAGLTDRILRLLENYTVILFDKIEPNPTSTTISEGLDEYKKHSCDLIIGFGGGSVLDAAKAIAILHNNHDRLEDYQSRSKNPLNQPEDYIAIPTTSGTSSEMTMWSVITNLEGTYKDLKKSIGWPTLYPKVAVIDPELTFSLPPYDTAVTGLDSLCQAIEGFWSKKHNPLSNIYCLEAIKLIVKYLPLAYTDGSNKLAREKMSFAMFLTGLGFSNSYTTSPHKVSFPITSFYHLPHGAACALTLPYFMEFIGSRKPELIHEIVGALGKKDYREAVQFLKNFVKGLGMPNRFSDIGLDRDDVLHLAKTSYVPVEKQEDPVPMSYEEYVEILESAL